MARYGILKRNIKRNIKPWSEDEAARARGDIVAISRVFAVLIALSLALSFVPAAVKVIFSIPDLYNFDLGRTQAADADGIDTDGGKIADMISAFMLHKTDNFQVEGGSESPGPPVFTANDGKVMATLRSFLDNIFVIGLTSLAVFIVLCVMLVRWDRPRELRRGFTGGFVLYGVFIGFFAASLVFKWPFVATIWTDVIGARFAPGDVMPRLFHSGLFLSSWIAVTVVTLVVMLVLASVVGRLARHERMFRGKR